MELLFSNRLRDEDRGDAEGFAVRVFHDVSRAGDVPCGIAPGFERLADPAVGGEKAVVLLGTAHCGVSHGISPKS